MSLCVSPITQAGPFFKNGPPQYGWPSAFASARMPVKTSMQMSPPAGKKQWRPNQTDDEAPAAPSPCASRAFRRNARNHRQYSRSLLLQSKRTTLWFACQGSSPHLCLRSLLAKSVCRSYNLSIDRQHTKRLFTTPLQTSVRHRQSR